MGRSRYLFTQPDFTQPDQPHFMTLTVLHWIPVFTRPETVDIVLNAFGYSSARDYAGQAGLLEVCKAWAGDGFCSSIGSEFPSY